MPRRAVYMHRMVARSPDIVSTALNHLHASFAFWLRSGRLRRLTEHAGLLGPHVQPGRGIGPAYDTQVVTRIVL